MKIVSFEYEGRLTYGIETQDSKLIWLLEDMIQDLRPDQVTPGDVRQLITSYSSQAIKNLMTDLMVQAPDPSQYQIPAGKAYLQAPLIPASNVIGFGRNYQEHIDELNSEATPYVFSKATSAIIGYGDEIPHHQAVTQSLDYEGELAVIIAQEAYQVNREEAMDYVYGYTIVNDISDREAQDGYDQAFVGKSLAGSCPMGPALITRDAISDPHNLRIITKVNGEIRQDGNTNQMMMKIPEIIEFLTRYIKLQPGDVIATGTPSGVGAGMVEPGFLQPGDLVEITIDGLGTLVNRVSQA